MPEVRVRFAPSPTGPLHIGGVRTALYNYLYARKHNGSFILRIEDTDQNRYVEGSEEYILEALKWCGLDFDEGPHKGGQYGPYRQSERRDIYTPIAEQMVLEGHAYYAFDSAEALDKERKNCELKGQTFSYNWQNRESMENSLSLSASETKNKIDEGQPYVIRFKSPKGERIQLQDEIRGEILIDTNVLDDKVLFKSDGMPTYHLANVVDDHLMKISHVIRGEEWLPSLALHQQLYDALGWTAPKFAHLPLIMKPEGKGKLSKRDGDKMGFPVFPLKWQDSPGYRESGYFPEAVVNFLALLGWNPGTDKELFSLDELVDSFSLDRVHKSGARFDPEKTKWYNGHYLQARPNRELALLLRSLIETQLTELESKPASKLKLPELSYIEQVVDLLKERATFVQDIWEAGDYFFIPPANFNEKAAKKHWKAGTSDLLKSLSNLLTETKDFSAAHLESEIKKWIASQEISFGAIMPPLRLALVGDLKGPHIFDIMALLGKQACLDRINFAITTIG